MFRWTPTFGYLAISCLAGCETTALDVKPPTVITVNKSNSDIPRFTVVLPPGWKLHPSNSGQSETFVFSPDGAEYPYLWVRIKKTGASSRSDQLKAAALKYRQGEFLGEGELQTTYFDPMRDLLWNRVESPQGLTIVTAELIHEEYAIVRYTDRCAMMQKSKPVVVNIVSHIKFYGENPPEYPPDSAADIGIDPELYAPRRQQKFSFFWFCVTTISILVLALINFELSRRRNRVARAEVKEACEARQAKAKLAKDQLPEAEEYVRKTLRTRSLQNRDDSG